MLSGFRQKRDFQFRKSVKNTVKALYDVIGSFGDNLQSIGLDTGRISRK